MTVENTLQNRTVSRDIQIPQIQQNVSPQTQEVEKTLQQSSTSLTPVSEDNVSSGSALAVAVDVSATLENTGNRGSSESFAGNVRVEVSFEGVSGEDRNASISNPEGSDVQNLLEQGAERQSSISQIDSQDASISSAGLSESTSDSLVNNVLSRNVDRSIEQSLNRLDSEPSGDVLNEAISESVNIELTLPEELKPIESQIANANTQGSIESYSPAAERANALNVSV